MTLHMGIEGAKDLVTGSTRTIFIIRKGLTETKNMVHLGIEKNTTTLGINEEILSNLNIGTLRKVGKITQAVSTRGVRGPVLLVSLHLLGLKSTKKSFLIEKTEGNKVTDKIENLEE